jgi:hypothetical protein
MADLSTMGRAAIDGIDRPSPDLVAGAINLQ